MRTFLSNISRMFFNFRIVFGALFFVFLCTPAHADILDAFNLSPFVPLVLEIMMNVATSLYNFFVGNGNGIIYILIYFFVGFYICLYLVKMHFPTDWLEFFGFSGGGEMVGGNIKPWNIVENILKPCFRAIIAAVFLLQIKPIYVTEWLVNPFLEFGSLYSEQILKQINNTTVLDEDVPVCPVSVEESGWISKRSCDFLVRPVYVISQENNKVIRYGFDFLKSGVRGMMNLIPNGGEDLLNLITGILLIFAFVASNLFMALLIIQAIFDFCLSLIMYPFNVLAWVAKKSDKWFDVLPAFSQIIDALKKLIITMISCAFILCINIAIIRALFNWSSSVFVASAGGSSISNVPSITNSAMNFGQHSLLWISALLTFFIMQNIFNITREKLNAYTNAKPDLYNNVTADASTMWGKIKSVPSAIKKINEKANK